MKPRKPLFEDTSPAAEQILMEGYRKMTAAEKWQKTCELNHLGRRMALENVRRRHPDASEKEIALRAATLWLEADLMRRAFGWDRILGDE